MFPETESRETLRFEGNSFIVRCHVTMNYPMNGCAVAAKMSAI